MPDRGNWRILGPEQPNVMQKIQFGIVAAVLLMTILGCGGCKGDADPITGRTCQMIPPPAGASYLCPEGYFCKYAKGDDMADENVLGSCQKMQGYVLCANKMLCDSPNYTPKCDSILDVAYCDFYQSSHRCGDCVPPGPLAEAEDDGGSKTPTTTTPANTTLTPTTTN